MGSCSTGGGSPCDQSASSLPSCSPPPWPSPAARRIHQPPDQPDSQPNQPDRRSSRPSAAADPTDPRSGVGDLATAPSGADPGRPGGLLRRGMTGRELLVSAVVFDRGGAIPKGRSVAAAYSPATGRWRQLPPAPGQVFNGEGGYHAVWTGRELLGWGMGLDAAYNPASNRWRPIAAAPIGAPSITVWTGRQVLMWGGGCCDDYLADGAAYTPATNTWQQLPASPLAGRHTGGAWTGKELIVVGGVGVASRHPTVYLSGTPRSGPAPRCSSGAASQSSPIRAPAMPPPSWTGPATPSARRGN
jgi:hypothetical protein